MTIQLYKGDCLEVMKKIPDKSVDCVITDPPYLHIKGGCKSKSLNVGCMNPQNKVVCEMSDFGEKNINVFLDTVKQKLKEMNGYFFCSKLQIPYYLDWALKNGVQFDVLVWDKCHTGIHSYKFFSTKYEYIIRLYKSGLNKIKDNMLYQKVQRYKVPHPKLHISEKPVELIENFIRLSTNECNVILDPFMGSGTTGVACKRLNRNFIGIESDDKYFEIAKNRIDGELL